jgi:hypothetical protein
MPNSNAWHHSQKNGRALDDRQQGRDLGRRILAAIVIVLALGTVAFLGKALITSLISDQTGLASPPNQSPFVLIGMTQMEVQERLGSPSYYEGEIWHYDTSKGTFVIEFQNDAAIKVRPVVFDLTAITPTP